MRSAITKNKNQGNRMASVFSNLLMFLLIISSRFAVIFGWCDRYSGSCSSYQVCCRNQCVYGGSCLYQSCSIDSDCSVSEVCCSGQCQDGYNCYGKSCSFSSDCSVGEDCCDGVCDYYCDDDSGIIIAFVIVGSFVAFFLLLMLIYYCYRRARLRRPGGVVIARPSQVTTTHSVINPPPQVFQQGYPYQSLPQYDQYQNAAPPPYSGGMATGSDLPPPYNPHTRGKPEEGHTSHPTYGAIPST